SPVGQFSTGDDSARRLGARGACAGACPGANGGWSGARGGSKRSTSGRTACADGAVSTAKRLERTDRGLAHTGDRKNEPPFGVQHLGQCPPRGAIHRSDRGFCSIRLLSLASAARRWVIVPHGSVGDCQGDCYRGATLRASLPPLSASAGRPTLPGAGTAGSVTSE